MSESLRAKLKDVTRAVYGEHQFLIISGLDTSQYNDVENVIIHAGLSSHVGSKRGMPGREGGDNTVLSEHTNIQKPDHTADMLSDHIIAMLTSPKGSTGQYHAPPNQARDIVSFDMVWSASTKADPAHSHSIQIMETSCRSSQFPQASLEGAFILQTPRQSTKN